MSISGNGSNGSSPNTRRTLKHCVDCGRALGAVQTQWFSVKGTGFCRRCGQKRQAFAFRAPEARRWFKDWTERLRLAMEVAGVPQDAGPRDE